MKKQSIKRISGTWAKWGITLCVLFSSFSAKADNDMLPDTVHVDEVVISSVGLRRFQAGAKIDKIPIVQIENAQSGNLEQLLSRYTPIAFKTNAGGLSTVRFRGTSPDHTSINFGGINLNSLTLGHSNVSNIPMYLFDKVGLQYGSSSAVNGSGSIGGAIHLGLNSNWVDGFKAEVRTSLGSFGEQLYGTKLYIGNGKWEAVTRAYYFYKVNDFTFHNPSIRNWDTGNHGGEDVQQNANINNQGIIQELNYRFAPNETIKFMAWVENDWHLIQQNTQTNYYQPEMRETMQDQNVRIWGAYDNRKSAFKYHAGAGYVYDNGIHDGTSDPIQTQRILGDAFIEHDLNSTISYKFGAKGSRIVPDVYAYDSTLSHEDRVDLFFSYRQQFFNKLRTTINLRQGFVTGFDTPFTPSIGLSYLMVSRENYIINLNGNIARNYRVPTFNDRYWDPGGNPDLQPELGMSYELGAKYSYCSGGLSGNFTANAFYMDVDNWILWKQGASYWYAENVQRVASKGFELVADVDYGIRNVGMVSGITYAYTSTQRISSENNSQAINRQMEYVPLNTISLFTNANYKAWDFGIDGRYMPDVYTDETDGNILESYFLLNANLKYHYNLNDKNSFSIAAMASNILNVDYQSSIGYAMPRANYQISLTYNFN